MVLVQLYDDIYLNNMQVIYVSFSMVSFSFLIASKSFMKMEVELPF